MKTVMQRLEEKISRGPDGCWLWMASTRPDGYGQLYFEGRPHVAHRVAYVLLVGPVPDGLQLDHLCRVRRCVNPAHLEPVTSAENTRRGDLREAQRQKALSRSTCGGGHALSGRNLRVTSMGLMACRKCERDKARRSAVAASTARRGPLVSVARRIQPGVDLLACGHEVNVAGLKWAPRRRCLACDRALTPEVA